MEDACRLKQTKRPVASWQVSSLALSSVIVAVNNYWTLDWARLALDSENLSLRISSLVTNLCNA